MPTAAGKESCYKDPNVYAKSQNVTFTTGNPERMYQQAIWAF
jgi:hypothetical protein